MHKLVGHIGCCATDKQAGSHQSASQTPEAAAGAGRLDINARRHEQWHQTVGVCCTKQQRQRDKIKCDQWQREKQHRIKKTPRCCAIIGNIVARRLINQCRDDQSRNIAQPNSGTADQHDPKVEQQQRIHEAVVDMA